MDLCRHWKVPTYLNLADRPRLFRSRLSLLLLSSPGRLALKLLRFLKLFAIIQYHGFVPSPLLPSVRTEEN